MNEISGTGLYKWKDGKVF
jgi:hypothetical protein